MLEPRDEEDFDLIGVAREVLALLASRGASFPSDIIASMSCLPSTVDETLWQLRPGGSAAADSLQALRHRLRGNSSNRKRASRARHAGPRWRSGYSRWFLVGPVNTSDDQTEDGTHSSSRDMALYPLSCWPRRLCLSHGESWCGHCDAWRLAERTGEGLSCPVLWESSSPFRGCGDAQEHQEFRGQ